MQTPDQIAPHASTRIELSQSGPQPLSQTSLTGQNLPTLSSRALTGQSFLLLMALCLLAALGNYMSVSLHIGLDFIFGSVFVLIAAVLYGPWWGAMVATCGSLNTVWLWHHPYAVIIAVSEAVVVGLLARRSQRSVLLLDGIYWFVAAGPITWFIYQGLLHFTGAQTYLVFVKDAVNGLLSALFASLFLSVASGRGWLIQLARATGTTPMYDRRSPLAHTLYNVLISTVLVPTVLLTVFNGQQARARIEAEIDNDLSSSWTALASVTRRWHENHLDALRSVVQRYNDEGQSRTAANWQNDLTFVKRSLPDFTGVFAADEKGRTFAYEPRTTQRGTPNIGLNFANRDYFQKLRATKRDVTSDVFQGRNSVRHMIAISTPVFQGKRWTGVVSGGVDLSRLAHLLRTSLIEDNLEATLVDSRGHVVASTRQNLKPGSSYDHRAPQKMALYQWSPSGRNLAALRRWNDSFRVRRAALQNGVPWELYVEAPYRAAQRELEAVYVFNLTTALGLVAGAFIIASLLGSALSAPLDELATATTDMPSQLLRRGVKVEQMWPRSRVREIDRLVSNFRSMEASLRLTMQDNLKARSDLEAERTRLDEANRLKDDFLAVLSHELRTPLVPVLGYADLIARGVLKGDDATDAARAVERNARAQLRLIEDLLDVSAIMSGKMRLQMGVVNLQVITREVGETLRTRAHDAEIGLFFDLDDNTPFFWGDAARLRQMIWHLLSNAVKFTPSGGDIRVKLSHHKNQRGEGVAVLVVADTGIGIEPAFLPYIFDRFRQAGDHMTRHAGGLGLGLAIVHHFIEMHGGSIKASSPGEDQGSTFTVTLPLTAIPRENAP